jgi:hypothetical protein
MYRSLQQGASEAKNLDYEIGNYFILVPLTV